MDHPEKKPPQPQPHVAHIPRADRPTFGRSRRVRARVGLALLVAFVLTIGTSFFITRVGYIRSDDPQTTLLDPIQYQAPFDWDAVEPKRSLDWQQCYVGNKCARLLLPLDYDTPDGPTTAIAIRMIPATDRTNYRGSIFVNPGGPGGSGVDFLERAGTNISKIVGSSFDVVSFDPRGIGRTTPRASCFDTSAQRDIWATQEGHQLINETYGLYRARAKALAERCDDRLGGEWGIGRFAGTANVARDMLEMTQLLGQDKLQYWGFSYGTILGQYFAAMFPDKIQRFVIDGVADAEGYRASSYDTDMVFIEDIISSLFTYCHQAGPEKCPLHDSDPSKIRERYLRVLDQVQHEPVPIPLAEPPTIITRKALLNQLFYATYKPIAQFPLIARTIRAIETGNQTTLAALARTIVDPTECDCQGGPAKRIGSEAFLAVQCGDGDAFSGDYESFRRLYAALAALSPTGMADMWAPDWLRCAEWKIRAKTRWTGPLNATETSHPLLVVSTRYDPVTPLTQARDVVKRFGGAVLLTQESHGHCSLSGPSLCTAKHIREYFVNGTLPKEGARCEVDELPFVGVKETARVLTVEDEELLDALRGLATIPMS